MQERRSAGAQGEKYGTNQIGDTTKKSVSPQNFMSTSLVLIKWARLNGFFLINKVRGEKSGRISTWPVAGRFTVFQGVPGFSPISPL